MQIRLDVIVNEHGTSSIFREFRMVAQQAQQAVCTILQWGPRDVPMYSTTPVGTFFISTIYGCCES